MGEWWETSPLNGYLGPVPHMPLGNGPVDWSFVAKPMTANPALIRQMAGQRAGREDVTDFGAPMSAPTWGEFFKRLATNLSDAFPRPAMRPDMTPAERFEATAPLREAAANMAMNAGPLATVYHGSPHIFSKFDMSKVGTGEGAQAYGHGLYFAENPSVARSYQNALTDLYPNGIPPAKGTPADRAAAYAAAEIDSQASYPMISASQKAKRFLDESDPQKRAIIDQLEQWHRAGTEFKRAGATYKVDLPDEHIAKMLDWDKPLAQQGPEVRAFIDRAMNATPDQIKGASVGYGPFGDLGATALAAIRRGDVKTGADLVQYVGNNPQGTAYLRSQGITGIKYLDQGSRAGGTGTSNFVVFDDQIPKILGRE